VIVAIIAIDAFVRGAIGLYVAQQKHRPQLEGLILGVLLGVFGIIVEAMLPTQLAPVRRPSLLWTDPPGSGGSEHKEQFEYQDTPYEQRFQRREGTD